MCIRPVMTYTCPVFAHAGPTALNDIQVIQNNIVKRATDTQWYIKNSVLHRDLKLPSIFKYMKDASERLFGIAINHPNPLISSAASYEAPPANHFIRRPRNVLTDRPNDLTAKRSHALTASLRRSLASDKADDSPWVTAETNIKFFGGFLVRESRTHPTHVDVWQLIRFFILLNRKEKTEKKTAFSLHPLTTAPA
ncbi:Probable RNA-directed DNA polymerase from transposon X-element [Eumeta japonica]|uniref:Probable RNA-directed DNA polymerase from transposon X-element n=1 Tax=Eumeta variegata TaxID=151549 RepID=A0A4C1USR1_EUMVA|nr:Probable RNA-directed DNA polymerase from transposon X-element [Eumeta japonica]